MSIQNIFKPKPNKFVLLLDEQTTITINVLELLIQYMQKRDASTAKQINAAEKQADEVRRILIEELMHSFITPFDREDIFALSREIDDVIDYANTTVEEMEVLDVDPTPHMQRMVSLLHDASVELEMGVKRLQDKHFTTASDHAARAKALENRVETVYREALADLFKGPGDKKHVMKVLKTREIYRHLSNASDRVDQAANIVADIIMKMS
jgi:uncharacterized protein